MQMTKKSLTSLLASALLLAAPASLRAQEQAWTMDSCMHYAVLHASGVQRQRIATRQREQDYRKAV
ncbi:MAG TPA: TolC family protein, partial [Prevotellaceae bacterium]|nr:TolC family protein [Prevotellaceae bacterium]